MESKEKLWTSKDYQKKRHKYARTKNEQTNRKQKEAPPSPKQKTQDKNNTQLTIKTKRNNLEHKKQNDTNNRSKTLKHI